MKIHIPYNATSGPWGGGNQFLKALRGGLISIGAYAETVNDADAVLFNSYNDLFRLMKFRFMHPKKKIIYRLGPVFQTYRPGLKWKFVDRLTIFIANLFADVSVFQSAWSHEWGKKLGLSQKKHVAIIGNAVDASLFFKKEFMIPGEKTKLVYSSWSSNMKKGFGYIKFLDEHLDFMKYSLTFVGNTPFQYKNIRVISPLPSQKLAAELRRHDVFVSPVEDDACSNALLEGLSSGLPAVALRSGGNPELVGRGGELFQNEAGLLTQIERVAKNLKSYYDAVHVPTIEGIARRYVDALKIS